MLLYTKRCLGQAKLYIINIFDLNMEINGKAYIFPNIYWKMDNRLVLGLFLEETVRCYCFYSILRYFSQLYFGCSTKY